MKLQAVEFRIISAARLSPGILQVAATGATTHVFYVFTFARSPIVLSPEALERAEIGDHKHREITNLLASIYYLNKQEIHKRADETA